jgi:hypothetical protein
MIKPSIIVGFGPRISLCDSPPSARLSDEGSSELIRKEVKANRPRKTKYEAECEMNLIKGCRSSLPSFEQGMIR